MRPDALPPRLLLLAALAAWALLAWGLALAGMGGRVLALANDPTLVQPLPTPPRAVAERLGPEAGYALIGSQSLFSDTRTPPPFVINSDKDNAPPAFEFLLTSVILTPNLKMAIIQPADGSAPVRMKLDESPEAAKGWRLVDLQPRSAVFEGPEGRRELPLRTWGGEPAPKDGAAAAAAPITGAAPASAPVPAPPAPLTAPARPEFTPPPQTPAQAQATRDEAARIEEIRRRIEARRAQVQQTLQAPPAPPATPPSTPPNRNP